MPGSFGEHLKWEEDAATRTLSLSLALPPATAGEGAAKRIAVEATIDRITAKVLAGESVRASASACKGALTRRELHC